MNNLKDRLSVIERHEPKDSFNDDIFLAQFGIRRLTRWRDTWKALKETELDRLMAEKNLLGAINDTVTRDCVCNFKGIQFYIFERYGQWGFGETFYAPDTGLCTIHTDDMGYQRYTVWPDKESRH